MKIVVASRKGGVGKSSVTAGLASYFASRGQRVLAIDLDPQSNLAFMLGADPTLEGTSALLSGEDPAPQEVTANLFVLAGGPDLARQDLARLDPEDLADALIDAPYDVIIFDSPPGSEHLERLGVVAADLALVITNAHPIAIMGAHRVLDELARRKAKERRGPTRWSVIMNMIDTRRSFDRHIEDLMGDVGQDVTFFKIKQDAKLAYSSACGVPLYDYAPQSTSAKAITEIGKWCIDGD